LQNRGKKSFGQAGLPIWLDIDSAEGRDWIQAISRTSTKMLVLRRFFLRQPTIYR
jgi:hypothetical protein